MGSERGWQAVGDLVTLQRGTTYDGSLVGAPGPALLGLGSIAPGGGFREGHWKTFGGQCPEKLMLQPGDIYVALKGATKDGSMIGSVARVPASVPSGRLTQDTAKLEFRSRDPQVQRYLYWILRTPDCRAYCAGRQRGTTAASLGREDFLEYPVPPMTGTRLRTVELLEALDDKIDLNRRMSQTFESMARALFKSWFVDFDPVRAKSEGRDPCLPNTLSDLFPQSFEDSELGEIPRGWRVCGLDEIATFLNGLALQKYPAQNGTGLPVIKIAQLHAGSAEGADVASCDLPRDYVVHDGDVLFSWSGSLSCEIWCGGNGALNQHLFKVASDRFPRWFYFLWTRQHLSDFQEIAAGKATTMGHIQRSHLRAARVLVPPRGMLDAMSEQFEPLIQALVSSSLESRWLATSRDSLLPRLLSGEVRLGERNGAALL